MCHSKYFTGLEALQEGQAGKARGELPFMCKSSRNAGCSALGWMRSQPRAYGSGLEGQVNMGDVVVVVYCRPPDWE